jgi:hypothetical protein
MLRSGAMVGTGAQRWFPRFGAKTGASWPHSFAQVGGGEGHTVVVVAEADGRIVSAARVEFEPGTELAGLWGGATLAAW